MHSFLSAVRCPKRLRLHLEAICLILEKVYKQWNISCPAWERMKTTAVLIGLIVFATVIVSGAAAQDVLFEDDMDEWKDPWMNPEDVDPSYGEITYENGALWIMDYTDDNWTTTTLEEEFSDFMLEVETELVEGNADNWFHIFTRGQDQGYYVFSISADGLYQILKCENGELQYLVEPTQSEYIVQGRDATNTVRIESIGDEMTLFVNDQRLETIHDSSFSTGLIALGAESFSGSFTTAAFDNLVIAEPS